jgi:hypothetical protein
VFAPASTDLKSGFFVVRRETIAFDQQFKKDLLAEKCEDEDPERQRLNELKRRNTLYPSHLQSSYPV